MIDEETLAFLVIGAAIEAHRSLGGPGLLESVYEEALCLELRERNIPHLRQKSVPIKYKGHQLSTPLRLDLLVDDRIVIECKAVTEWNPVYAAQALTYLRLLKLRLAIVINFGEVLAKNGVHRVVNGYPPETS